MKMKKYMAIALAATMLTLAGCGNTNDSSSVSDVPASTEATTTAEEATATAVEVKTTETETTATETTPTTEPATEVQDDKYAYYKDLAAEFEECGLCIGNYTAGNLVAFNSTYLSGSDDSNAYYHKGKVYFLYCDDSISPTAISLISYDIASGEMTSRPLEGCNGAQFSGGKFKYGSNGKIFVGDVDDEGFGGFISTELSENDNHYTVLPSGALIEWKLYSTSGDGMCSYYSEETGEILLPLPTIIDEHGLEQKVDATYMAAYGNKVYYCIGESYGQGDRNFIYCLDLEKKEWEKKPTSFEVSSGYGVGKYLFMRNNKEPNYIYNMETDEMVAIIAEYKPYYGGEQHVFMYKGRSTVPYVTEYKFPSDGSQPEEKVYNNVIPITANGHFPVTGKYFLFVDSAGIFLRTYDNSEPEAIIMVFEH